MLALDKDYEKRVEEIKVEITESEELTAYLDSEDEVEYRLLIEKFEPTIFTLHQEVAKDNPLQLLALETEIMAPEFEGLFIPKILGYSVLRGVINEDYLYRRPQNHFKGIVEYICNSINFEMLKIRIGQSLQMGLALSSDIWTTHLINQFTNKKIKYYLESRNPSKYHYKETRKKEYLAYSKQFRNDNYLTTFFPMSKSKLQGDFHSLYQFMVYRMESNLPADSYFKLMEDFCTNKEFMGTKEHVMTFFLFLQFMEQNKASLKVLKPALKELSGKDNFPVDYYQFRLEVQDQGIYFFRKEDEVLQQEITKTSPIHDFIETCMEIHEKGYIHDDAINKVKKFYNTHQGSSIENQCLRKLILSYFKEFLTNIDPDEYEDYMEFSKIFPIYLEIFDNEQFLLELRAFNMAYLRKLVKTYTDKRGRDYQDIKKFVSSMFEELNFYKAKEIKEFFKTKRKKTIEK